MAITVRELNSLIDSQWPLSGQEDWDNSGLVSGSPDSVLKSALLVVDVTDETVSEAIDGGHDVLIAHHPLLLRGIMSIAEDRYKGELLARLIRAKCALIAIHTNGDRVPTGTSATLASAIGLTDTQPLVENALGGGMGVHGKVAPQTLGDFARAIAAALPSTAGGVRVAGDFARQVATVSLCAGAGDSLLTHPMVRSSDVYVSSDLRHHPASEFREQARLDNDTALIDISHWAAEWLWLDQAAKELRGLAPELAVTVSHLNTDPWTFAVVQ
jgi:dinuclear metal center YbgI/SA1388 family protein